MTDHELAKSITTREMHFVCHVLVPNLNLTFPLFNISYSSRFAWTQHEHTSYHVCVGTLLCQQSALIKMNDGNVLLRNRVMKSDQSSNISSHVSFIWVTDVLSAVDAKQEGSWFLLHLSLPFKQYLENTHFMLSIRHSKSCCGHP